LNTDGVNGVRQIYIQTAELLVSDSSPSELKVAIGKMKSYTSSGTGQIPGEVIQSDEILRSEIHKIK
jgi:hypothetical protein